ncbi:Non-receptor tyrosine kinase spore lysis A [Pelomyxa schiedti]|nr:Non-receptor tyrosine kinase spore lysis A [Pelomyxa schiedti]
MSQYNTSNTYDCPGHSDTSSGHHQRHQHHRSSAAPAVSLLLRSLVEWQKGHPIPEPGTLSAHCGAFLGPSGKPPGISLLAYLQRIEEHSGCPRSTLIAALIYIDRLLISRAITLTEANVHRVLWSCFVVAHKFFEDHYYTSTFYSQVGGVTLSEMNIMEASVLQLLKFELFISADKYKQYEIILESSIAYCSSQQRRPNHTQPAHISSSPSPQPFATHTPPGDTTTLPASHLIAASVD